MIGAGNEAPIEPAAACAQMSGKPDLAYYFDGTKARERALGAPVPEDASKARIEKLAGRYEHPRTPGSLDDSVVWTLAKDGTLLIERTSAGKKPVTTKEPQRLLVFTRERQFAIVMGTSKQFVPVFVDESGDLLLSWTTGAMAVPIVDEKTFAIPLDTDDRWIVRVNAICNVVDPKAPPRDVPCRDEGDKRFVVELDGKSLAWTRHDKILVPATMERFAKK